MVLHGLSKGHVHHVPHVGQGFGSEAAFPGLIAIFAALIEECLQITGPQGVHVQTADLRLDMGADIELVAAISRMLDGGPGVVLQPTIHPCAERNDFRCGGILLASGTDDFRRWHRRSGSQCFDIGSGICLFLEALRFPLTIHLVLIDPALVFGLV